MSTFYYLLPFASFLAGFFLHKVWAGSWTNTQVYRLVLWASARKEDLSKFTMRELVEFYMEERTITKHTQGKWKLRS